MRAFLKELFTRSFSEGVFQREPSISWSSPESFGGIILRKIFGLEGIPRFLCRLKYLRRRKSAIKPGDSPSFSRFKNMHPAEPLPAVDLLKCVGLLAAFLSQNSFVYQYSHISQDSFISLKSFLFQWAFSLSLFVFFKSFRFPWSFSFSLSQFFFP